MIVADTNLLAYLLLPSPHSSLAEAVFQSDADWVAPLLWRSEFRNVLSLYIRQRLLTLEAAEAIWIDACSVFNNKEQEVDGLEVLRYASKLGCSAYDAEFVTLAAHLNIPLLTFDLRLLKAASGLAVHPHAWLAQR